MPITPEQQENPDHNEETPPEPTPNIPQSEEENHSQPDQEPSVTSNEISQEVNQNEPGVDPSTIPVPSSDSEASMELFVEEEDTCFNCSTDQVWMIEIDITQKDIDNWKSESEPSCMAFVVSAAKKQRAEVKLSELTSADRKLFEEAKGKEIDSWISTETVARILRHRIPQENIHEMSMDIDMETHWW